MLGDLAGQITVNGTPLDPNQPLKSGDAIQISNVTLVLDITELRSEDATAICGHVENLQRGYTAMFRWRRRNIWPSEVLRHYATVYRKQYGNGKYGNHRSKYGRVSIQLV